MKIYQITMILIKNMYFVNSFNKETGEYSVTSGWDGIENQLSSLRKEQNQYPDRFTKDIIDEIETIYKSYLPETNNSKHSPQTNKVFLSDKKAFKFSFSKNKSLFD